ncbi:cation diffusion facilitator family transporter [Dietzia timorensis]|uniref:Cation efflux system protein CzcD n=1 Tax=Dietzia timorensis TaxID=499555 RepID=A0A173LJ72_9ACTN|nr:cation diffusion facilitator family transporter [Dietzia timorensis]ANI92366.1 Cation efflux system protein CzcD [Dietzia timorensis]
MSIGHNHGAGQSHGHGHDHASPTANPGARRRLAIAFAITALIVIAQAVGAAVTGSLALLTDTAHALVDASGLLVALIAATMMMRPPSSKRTWGFARIEIVAALGQATLLLVVGTYTAFEGITRLFDPPEVPSTELLIFGVIGLIANIVAMAVLLGGRNSNMNMKAAFLEVLNDALGSIGVIIAAILIWTTGFQQADALAGLFIAALIAPRAFRIMRESLRVLMEFTPRDLDLDEVRARLLRLEHVTGVHDVHASTIGTGLPILTAHLVIHEECFNSGHAPDILENARRCLDDVNGAEIEHATFQLETAKTHASESATVLHE